MPNKLAPGIDPATTVWWHTNHAMLFLSLAHKYTEEGSVIHTRLTEALTTLTQVTTIADLQRQTRANSLTD